MREQTGHCPSCHAAGPVGQPCLERSCQRRGYHFIPEYAFDKVREQPPARTDPRIGQCIGDYLLVDVLGCGGFGKVYLALQLPILMKTALKVMERADTDQEMAAALAKRFEGEAAALATLTHPNIVRLLKYGVHEGMPYLVMEFVEGNRTLRHEMQSGALAPGRSDPKVAAHILHQVLNALDAAHARSIVHRDVKPENVMLQEVSGDPWFVKVLDFGLAKFVEERNETSLMVGTPAYMAPEQITRKGIGPWTDLYAVGVLAFRLVTGRLPFLGDSTQETYAMKLDPAYDPMSQVAGMDLSPLVAGFLRRAIATDPEARFRSASEFREAFDAVANGIGATSPDVTPAYGALYAPPVTPAPPVAVAPTGPTPPPAPPPAPSIAPGITTPSPEPRPQPRIGGDSLTEQVRRVGDDAFAQMASPSVATRSDSPSRVMRPVITERIPRRRATLLGPLLLVLLGLVAGVYLYEYGFSTAPLRQAFLRAAAYVDEESRALDATTGAASVPPGQRTASIRLVTSPPGARVRNGDTNDDLGRTPTDLLIPPGTTLRLNVQMEGYRDEVLSIPHAEAVHQPEWPLHLKRQK